LRHQSAAAGAGGAASAAAHVEGAGGSEARARATGGRGGDGTIGATSAGGGAAALADAVSGRDATALVLEQSAAGGGGGQGSVGGAGGHAASTGDFTNAAGGDLAVSLSAVGGAGSFRSEHGNGGDAHVGGSATSVGSGDVSLMVFARSGSGREAGALQIDPLVANASGGGDASVALDAGLGASRAVLSMETPSPFLSLVDRVDANAAPGARIALTQSASSSGGAESVLDVAKSAALLDVEANASGGEASVVVHGSNDAGDLLLSGFAAGGRPLGDDPLGARAEFEARTTGDGHDIEIGSSSRPAGARGGRADQRSGAMDVRGGAAEVLASAIALGNSAVRMDVVAEGGPGDEFHGGDAAVRAEGIGGGTELVQVTASALGDRDLYAIGGNADAEAIARGLGAVSALAIAHGGVHDDPGPGGGGFARAHASGASGEAAAAASTTTLFDGEQADDEQYGAIQVGLAATVAGDVAVAASSQRLGFAPGSDDAAFDGFIRSAYRPDASVVAAAVAGNPRAASAPPPEPRLSSLVEFAATSSGGLGQTYTAEIVIGQRFGFGAYDDVPEGILVSFLDPELYAAAFGSLTLRSFDIEDPADLYEISFANALDALAFLDDGRLLFAGEPRQRQLEIVLETTGVEGGFFLDLIIATVPEPSALALLALALAAVAARRVVASRPS
jgi:hypothetical protein